MNLQESKKLEAKILKTLSNHLSKEEKVIVGVSGGADSVFLLKMLELFDSQIIVAHLNHQLRDKESDLDEKFVQNLGQNHIFESKSINIKSLSEKTKKGIEETGRVQRYQFFNELLRKYDAKYILTAHHADDSLETVLMNLVRGASLSGLSGMQFLHKNIFRPLIEISKKEICTYLKFHKIKYRIDQSNFDPSYKRNFLRQEIIPKLKDLNPSLSKTISKNSQNLREIDLYIKEEAKKWIDTNSLNDSKNKFPANEFRKAPRALQNNILKEIHEQKIGNLNNLEQSHLSETLNLIKKNIGKKEKKFGKLKLSLDKNIIQISKTL